MRSYLSLRVMIAILSFVICILDAVVKFATSVS